ncbi:MAG: RNA-binding protein [Geobacteraceae bacterium]|nr:RNA-binding protein [Geobacteraceae bacterium]
MAKEIYVGHISENATEEDVWKLFSVMGTVTSVHLIIDPDTGEFKRCGYVRMASGIDLAEVVETLDGTYLVDREIVVSIARPQKPGMSKSGGNRQPWMKSGPRPEAKPGTKPKAASGARPAAAVGKKTSPRPDTRAETAADQRQKPGKTTRPALKPAASRPDARPTQSKGPIPPRPRKSK